MLIAAGPAFFFRVTLLDSVPPCETIITEAGLGNRMTSVLTGHVGESWAPVYFVLLITNWATPGAR